MNNFDRRHLRYFVAVAEDLHFGRAAQRLNVSQPSLSQQIVALENDLGVQLFERTRRSVELTAAGQQFLRDAKNILSEMAKAALRAHAADEGCAGVLHIALNYSAPFHAVPAEIFRRFADNYPGVRLELCQETGARQLERLYQHTLDLCFVWPTEDDFSDDLTFIPLDKDDVRLVVSTRTALANKSHLSVSDLRGQALLLMPWQQRTAFYSALTDACTKEGMRIDPRMDIIQMPFAMSLVAAKQGITFVPSFLDRIRPAGTVFRTFNFLSRTQRSMPLYLACRASDTTPATQNFLTDAHAVIAEFNKAKLKNKE